MDNIDMQFAFIFQGSFRGGRMGEGRRGEDATVEYWDAALVLKWFARVWLVQMTVLLFGSEVFISYLHVGREKKRPSVVFLVLAWCGYRWLLFSLVLFLKTMFWKRGVSFQGSPVKECQLEKSEQKRDSLHFQLLISEYDDMWRRLANVCHCGQCFVQNQVGRWKLPICNCEFDAFTCFELVEKRWLA